MIHQDPYAIFAIALLLFTLGYLSTHFTSPLRSIPGPFLARFTRLWYFRALSSGHFHTTNFALHARYGPIVRLAPGQYSLSDPSAIPTIYKPKHGSLQFRKADSYSSFEPPHRPNIFSTRDVTHHAQHRRKLNSAYTMSVMTSYEGYVDDCVEVFERRLREMSIEGREVNMAWWMQCFAFDLIGEITYSKRFGFLDDGQDKNGLIENVHENTKYGLLMGIFSEWHVFYQSAVGVLSKMGLGSAGAKKFLLDFTLRSEEERQREMEKAQEGGYEEDVPEGAPKDFMTKFVEQHLKDSSHFTLADIISAIGANINAGSDTTGITLSAITYYLVKNPQALQRLREDIEQNSTTDPITFKEAQHLEYLQAVIKEALRLHPPVSIPLARVVPEGGALISGQFFPAGTVVGVNPYIVHHDREVFGDDVEGFRPERWLKNEKDPETLARMEHSWCPFGIGSRLCIGKNISLLEISKLVPQMVRRFDLEMSEELKREGLKTTNEFFVLIDNLQLKVRERTQELL